MRRRPRWGFAPPLTGGEERVPPRRAPAACRPDTLMHPRVTTVSDDAPASTATFRLMTIKTEPGGGNTEFEFLLPEAGRLEVGIYSVTGRLVAGLGGRRYDAGLQTVFWDRTAGSSRAAAGVYFVRGVLGAGQRDRGVAHGRIVVTH